MELFTENTTLDPGAARFVLEHNIAVISTVDAQGMVSGAVVYYLSGQDGQTIDFITKSESQKARNIVSHQQVAVTIYDAAAMQTIQINGKADIITDQQEFDKAYEALIHPRPYQGELLMPPVTVMKNGEYVLIRVVPTSAIFSDYKEQIKKQSQV